MLPRNLCGRAISAIAGIALMTTLSDPSIALTLYSPSLTSQLAAPSVEQVYWHRTYWRHWHRWGWHPWHRHYWAYWHPSHSWGRRY